MCCVQSHRHVSDHKWTVNEWRLALCCAGINWTWNNFCVSSTSHFITGPKRIQDYCLVVAVSLKWGLPVAALWDMYQSGTSSLWRGYHIKWDNCDWWNVEGLQTETYQSSEWYCTVSTKTWGLTVCHPCIRWSFWHTMPEVFLCIILCSSIQLWICSIKSHFCS